MPLTLTSPAFGDKGTIPPRYTCDGANVSPPLAWSGLPQQTRSLALVVEDPDAPDPKAPQRPFVHWVLYNIPPDAYSLAEAVERAGLPTGTLQGMNDRRRSGFDGACPPIGRHRYLHKLYALDTVLPNLGRPTKKELEQAMEGHILATTELVGIYERPH